MLEIFLEEVVVDEALEEEAGDVVVALEKEVLTGHPLNATTIVTKLATFNGNVLVKQEEMLLMAYMENEQAENREIWYLDSGCNNHMTGNKNLFCDLNESFRQSVKLGNDSSMSVMGKGSVKVQMNRKMQKIYDVYYVP